MDLWLSGNLYPTYSFTWLPLQFRSYPEFLCHGDSDLLGYSKLLVTTNDTLKGLEHEL